MTSTRHEEFQPSIRNQTLPEGVRAFGWRYQAVIATPTRTHIIGEFETIKEAEQAYQSALHAQWNG